MGRRARQRRQEKAAPKTKKRRKPKRKQDGSKCEEPRARGGAGPSSKCAKPRRNPKKEETSNQARGRKCGGIKRGAEEQDDECSRRNPSAQQDRREAAKTRIRTTGQAGATQAKPEPAEEPESGSSRKARAMGAKGGAL